VSESIPDVAGVEHEFVDAGGLRTHVALAGEGPPLLLLHGWPQHWYLWRDVIPVVAPHARVIVPDLRGFGWTEVPETGYEKVQLARDVLALLDELGIGEVIVAGHDWGGYVGFLLAMEHPDRIRGLLAANILPPWPPRDRRVALDSWRFLYQPVLGTPHVGRRAGRAIARRGLADAGLSPTDVDAFVSRLEGERGVAGERLYRTFFFGQRDQVLSTRAVEDVARQSDRIELELVPDATHFVVDEKPELIADRALRLLASPVTG
jgi:pimeloyl-ACP methyl ester carboxylesterase